MKVLVIFLVLIGFAGTAYATHDPTFNHPTPFGLTDLPPLKQIQNGIALFDVVCSDDKIPAYKSDNMSVACVTEETHSKLVNRGWALLRFTLPDENPSEVLCNRYDGKWHSAHNGCRGDISDLQCSLMGGEFVDNLKICHNDICPENKTYTLCVTEQNTTKYTEISGVEKLLIENKINYLPDKLVVNPQATFSLGDPGCGAVVDVNSKTHWFGIDSISNPQEIRLFDKNPNQCMVNTGSCFCNAQIKLSALTLDELDYFTPQQQEKYANILIDYLYEENINRTPKFMIGKQDINYTDPDAIGYCGKIWGTATRDYFSGAIVNGTVKDYGIDKELPLMCAISDDAQYFGKAYGEK